VESLGHRSQLWSSSALVVKSAPIENPAEARSPFSRSSLRLMQSAPEGAFPAATPTRSSSSQQFAASTVQTSELFKNQARAVRALNMGLFRGRPPTDGARPCSDLAACVSIPSLNSIDQDGLNRSDLIGYKNLLEMMAEMTGEKTSRSPCPAKHFSTACFSPTDVAPAALGEKRRFLTYHALKHLQDQIWGDWSSAVDAAVQQGLLQLPPSSAGQSRNQRLRAYVGQLWFNGDITPTRNLVLSPLDPPGRETPVFAYIYHCLRIGELGGAINEVEGCIQRGLRNVEKEVLTCLQGFLMITKNLSDSLSINNPMSQTEAEAFTKAMSTCAVLYEEEGRKNERDLDPYREYVFNILSLRDLTGLSDIAIPGSSLEDFLWGNLWFVQWSALVSKATASAIVSRQKALQNGESALYERVLEYGGADYFDADYSCPFNYCTVLFSCHRFGDAIGHLWQAGKFLPAVHLTVACLYYGLLLPHRPLTHNPRHSSGDRGVGSNMSPVSLFEMFFSSALQSSYPELTADYLVILQVDWHQHVQGIEQQLLETLKRKCDSAVGAVLESFLLSLGRSQLIRMVGEPIEDSQPTDPIPFRTRGHLDEYLSPVRLRDLLTSCAYHLLTVKKESEKAMAYFKLAGRHSDVVEELCNRLSCAISTSGTISPADKTFWSETAVKYYTTYINVGRSSVLNLLESDGKQGLVSVFETLLNLTVFVDICATRPSDALDIIDGLFIFPKSAEEVQPASQHFRTIDMHIRRVADDVLILTAEAAKALYARGGGAGGMRGVLSEKEQER
jgi:Nup93/Nic96